MPPWYEVGLMRPPGRGFPVPLSARARLRHHGQRPCHTEETAMRIPPPPERIKEAPAHALRAVFAGVGQVLLITERVRQRAIEQVHPQMTSAPAHAPAPDVPPPPPPRSAAAAATQATASRVAAPAAAATQATASRIAAPAAAAPAVARAEAPAPEAGAPQGGAAGLPVPNYDELSIASLR